jgi:hypothetical protein
MIKPKNTDYKDFSKDLTERTRRDYLNPGTESDAVGPERTLHKFGISNISTIIGTYMKYQNKKG